MVTKPSHRAAEPGVEGGGFVVRLLKIQACRTRGVALVLLLLLTFACSKDKRVPLRVIGESVPTTQALAKIAPGFEREFGVRVIVEQYEFETAVEKATLDLSSQRGYYDVVLQPHLSLGKFVTSGFLQPVDSYLKNPRLHRKAFVPAEQLFPVFWRELSWYDGRVYGFPFTANTMYVAYRSDLMTDEAKRTEFRKRYGYELAPPATWAQYRDEVEFFTAGDGSLYGTALQAKRHPSVWYEWLNFANSWGGGVMEKKHGWEYGPVILACAPTVSATEFYRSLKNFSPPGVSEYTWDDQLADMQQGKVFMAVMWSDAIPALEDSSQSKFAGKFGYAPLPAGPAGRVGQIAGWSYLISRFSKQKELAYRFVEWSLTPEHQIAQQLNGGASALRVTYNSPLIKKLPYVPAYTATLERAVPMSDSFPEATAVSDTLQACLSEIVATDVNITQKLRACSQEIATILQDHHVVARCMQ